MRTRGTTIFSALIGLSALAVLLQGLWAGLFLRYDGKRDASEGWIDVHARGGDVAILLAALATVAAFLWLRHRKDLWLGAGVVTVLMLVEGWLGGLIRDDGKDALTAVHVPLAMLIMGLVTWLPFRARRGAARSLDAAYPGTPTSSPEFSRRGA